MTRRTQERANDKGCGVTNAIEGAKRKSHGSSELKREVLEIMRENLMTPNAGVEARGLVARVGENGVVTREA